MSQLPIHFQERTPLVYTCYFPHSLFKITYNEKSHSLDYYEVKLYNELLNINHADDSQRDNLVYDFDLKDFLPQQIFDNRNASYYYKQIKLIQSRVFFVDKDLALLIFGNNHSLSFNPFPLIEYIEKRIRLHLNPYLKELLKTIKIHGYIKGDILALRELKSIYSVNLYWHIRLMQPYRSSWEVPYKTLRNKLGLDDGQFVKLSDFVRRVIKPIQNEFTIHYVKFDFEIESKSGESVFKFTFLNGPGSERSQQLVIKHNWEDRLLKHGVSAAVVKNFQTKVQNHSLNEEVKFYWTNEYMEDSVKAFETGVGFKPGAVINKASYLYNGLMKGQWLAYHADRERQRNLDTQKQLFNPIELQVNKIEDVPVQNVNNTSEYIEDILSRIQPLPSKDIRNIKKIDAVEVNPLTENIRRNKLQQLTNFYNDNYAELIKTYPNLDSFLNTLDIS